MIKEYSIEKSPLYRLRSKKKLAILLGLPENYFKTIHTYKYYKFCKKKKDGLEREINNPEDELKIIQKKVFNLLNRIEKPNWIISGRKKLSYVDNAKFHQLNDYICTIDIEKFYDSTKEIYVYNFFRHILKMEIDIATILTKLVTYEGRIPTGTPTSQLIAFLSYKDIFFKINEICNKEEITFSLYVDDITLSSNKVINKKIKYRINNLLNLKELKIKKSKTKFYSKKNNKSVTGTIINSNHDIKLENSKRLEILKLYRECLNPETYTIKKIVALNGKISDANQVERGIFPQITMFLKEHKEDINKYNKEQALRKRYIKQKIVAKRNKVNIMNNC